MEDFDCDDVAALDPLDENAVVKFIGGRYRAAPEGRPAKHHLIYTRAGPVVVAVNPLQNVPDLYTEAERRKYARAASERAKAEKESRVIEDSDLPPHIYEVSAKAYCGMCDGRSQAVVINGESGAGKTETAKILVKDISEKSAQAEDDLAARLLASSPVLEAFGNAKTLRNDNSSRFGKLIKLHFTPNGQLSHASVAHDHRTARHTVSVTAALYPVPAVAAYDSIRESTHRAPRPLWLLHFLWLRRHRHEVRSAGPLFTVLSTQ